MKGFDLKAALQRLRNGSERAEDIEALKKGLVDGRIAYAKGDRSVAITGDFYGLVNTGDNVTFPLTAEAIEKLKPPPYTPPEAPEAGFLSPRGALPPGSRLLFSPNAVFTGREKDMLDLWAALQPGADAKVVATGMGGVGKTQLAVEFCYRYGCYYHGVHWLGANRNLDAEVASCGLAMLLLPWPQELPEQVATTLNAWGQGGKRLVVLDNADGEASLRAAQEWLPRLGNAQVLITSRRREWPPSLGLTHHLLDTLEQGESLDLVRKLVPRLERTADMDLHPLRERLGDLPLALDLAGGYLKKRFRLSVKGYLKELDKAQSSLAHKTFLEKASYSPTGHDTSLVDTYLLSWNQLADGADGELAQRVFCTLAYCAPQTSVPWKVLEAALAGEEENGGEPPLDEALTALAELGLAEWGENGPELHPLLADFGRLQDRERETSALPGLANALKVAGREALNTGLPVSFAPLRAHVEAVAESVKQAGKTDAADLWNDLGLYLAMIANYSEARAFYELGIKLFVESYEPIRPEVAGLANNLGDTLRALGEVAEAKKYLEWALEIKEKIYEDENIDIAITVNNLGGLLQDLGDLEGAQKHFQRALVIYENELEDDHPNIAMVVNNLGGVMQKKGDLDGARKHYERALVIDQAFYGPEHPKVAQRHWSLGTINHAEGDMESARIAYLQALEIFKKFLPPDHPNIQGVQEHLEMVDLVEIFKDFSPDESN